jgi:hypothetical protein
MHLLEQVIVVMEVVVPGWIHAVLFIMAKFRYMAKKQIITQSMWRKEGAFQCFEWMKPSPYSDGLLIAQLHAFA